MTINVIQTLDAIAGLATPEKNAPPAGSFLINKCEIHHGDDSFYDISLMVQEIHLYEDIEGLGITGHLKLRDDVNLVRNGPIIGEELLWMSFETAGATDSGNDNFAIDYTKTPLYVYKVEAIKSPKTSQGVTNQSVLEYRIHFCSPELITNDRIKISKTYKGKISDIVTKVMRDDLGVSLNKQVWVLKTEDLYHFVVPRVSPLAFIMSLTQRARATTGSYVRGPQPTESKNLFKGHHSDFIFFETAARINRFEGGWFFVPAQRENLAASGSGTWALGNVTDLSITLNNAATTTGTEDASGGPVGYSAVMLRSLSYEFTDNGDKWNTVEAGAWAGLNIKHDGLSKTYDMYKCDYLEQLKDPKYSHASNTPVYWPPAQGDKKISEWPEANINLFSSSPKSKSSIDPNTNSANYPWRKVAPEHSLLRNMQMNHMLNNQRITVEMLGLSGLQIGRMVQTVFPAIGKGSGTPEETGLAGSHDIYGEDRNNNTWMITKLGHHIMCSGENNGYTTTMEMINTRMRTRQVLPAYGVLDK